MCGISMYFARESVIDKKEIDKLLSATEKRGTDGFGFVIVDRSKKDLSISVKYPNQKYSDVRKQVLSYYEHYMKIGDIFIAISRAAPETEPETTEINCQPIINEHCILVHNGAISQRTQKFFEEQDKYKFETEIDSECIIASYILNDKNIKKAMEFISGGVAAILYDLKIDRLYMITDFKPLAQCYIKGYGYMLNSSIEPLNDIIESVCNTKRDGICLWENYYHHYWNGNYIYALDCDSGFIQQIKYSPRYLAHNFDSNSPKYNNGEELCLVATSGGLDSSMTLWALKTANYKNIIACHFKYGHRGQDCEELAIRRICKLLNIKLKIFDVENLFKSIDQSSMLIDKNAKITTGTEGLKDVDAWVCGRNMTFMTIMASYAESLVMKHGYSKVNFLGGFLNLSEAGVYGDNSEYFVDSCLNMFKYGTLIGNRIQINYGLSDLMKSDLLYLIKYFDLYDLYKNTISCDRPKLFYKYNNDLKDVYELFDKKTIQEKIEKCDEKLIPCNCKSGKEPACGSGALSYWASLLVGLNDMEIRNFYEVNEKYKLYQPSHKGNILDKDIINIIERIHFPKDKIENLKYLIETKGYNYTD